MEIEDYRSHPPFKWLKSEEAHCVKVNLRRDSLSLPDEDLKSITNLIARLPGLPNYEVTLIRKSALYEGALDVIINPNVIVVKKETKWEVITIHSSSP